MLTETLNGRCNLSRFLEERVREQMTAETNTYSIFVLSGHVRDLNRKLMKESPVGSDSEVKIAS